MRKRMPVMNLILPLLVPKDLRAKLAAHWAHTVAMTKKRVVKKDTITRTDFFQHILENGMMEEELLQQNANILIIAGSETTATALAGCLYRLMHNEDCLATLQKEVRNTFDTLDVITGDATQKLPYLHACVEEALRIYPPVAFGLQRVSHGAFVDGHWVPPGALVSSQNWIISHDERYWQDPDSFKPERWLNEGLGDNKDAFQPFSLGPRACIGINLAYLEIRVILAKTVWQYDFELLSKELDWEKDNIIYRLSPTLIETMADANTTAVKAVRTWQCAVDEFQKMEASVRKLFTVTKARNHPSAVLTYTFVPVWTIDPTFFSVTAEQGRRMCDFPTQIQPDIQASRKRPWDERLLIDLENFDKLSAEARLAAMPPTTK
ncbi:hypothetical protein E8E11_003375 [Didymella keratinophila]|nr:hypothetical protein E8E11_003375 [Didymella keratinophila]